MPTNKKRPGPQPHMSKSEVARLVRKAKIDATNDAVSLTLVLMMTVLLDKFGMENQIRDVYDAWNERARDVLSGEIKLHEWRDVLRKEYGISI